MERIVITEYASKMAEVYNHLKQVEEEAYNLLVSQFGPEVGEASLLQIKDETSARLDGLFSPAKDYLKKQILNNFEDMIETGDNLTRAEIA